MNARDLRGWTRNSLGEGGSSRVYDSPLYKKDCNSNHCCLKDSSALYAGLSGCSLPEKKGSPSYISKRTIQEQIRAFESGRFKWP